MRGTGGLAAAATACGLPHRQVRGQGRLQHPRGNASPLLHAGPSNRLLPPRLSRPRSICAWHHRHRGARRKRQCRLSGNPATLGTHHQRGHSLVSALWRTAPGAVVALVRHLLSSRSWPAPLPRATLAPRGALRCRRGVPCPLVGPLSNNNSSNRPSGHPRLGHPHHGARRPRLRV